MIMRMFALKDRKMNLFMNPMFFASRGQAVRVVADEVNRPINGDATTLQSHPEDMFLYDLGEFDSESGEIRGAVVEIGCCKDFASGRQ